MLHRGDIVSFCALLSREMDIPATFPPKTVLSLTASTICYTIGKFVSIWNAAVGIGAILIRRPAAGAAAFRKTETGRGVGVGCARALFLNRLICIVSASREEKSADLRVMPAAG